MRAKVAQAAVVVAVLLCWACGLACAGGAPFEEVLSQTQTQPAAVGLRDVYRQALQKNERIGYADENLLQAGYYRRQALSGILPSLTFQGTYFRQRATGSTGIAGQSFLIDRRSTYSFQVEQNIFSGLQEQFGLRQATVLSHAAEQELQRQKDLLLLDVAQAFYDSLKLQAEVENTASTLKLRRELLAEAQARNEVGLARYTDVLLIETEVAGDESDLIRSENALRTTRDRLDFVAGAPVEGVLLDDLEETGTEPEAGKLVAKARMSRPDYLESLRLLEAAKYGVRIIRGEYSPTLDFTGNYYTHREGIQAPVNWDFQVTLKFALFSGGETRAKELQALSKQRQAELNRSRLEREIKL